MNIDELNGFSPDDRIRIIRKATEILDNGHRWIKGRWRQKVLANALGEHFDEPKVCYCIEGALDEAAYKLGLKSVRCDSLGMDPGATVDSTTVLVKKIKMVLPSSHGKLRGFNDYMHTTWDDINFVLKQSLSQAKADKAESQL